MSFSTSPQETLLTIWIASDHAGFELKKQIIAHLKTRPCILVHDGGPYNEERVDYPTITWPVIEQIAAQTLQGNNVRGILICGTGIGVSLVANRHPEIRAALAHNLFTAEMARRHNDAQVLCLGARIIDTELALAMTDTFLDTPFEGGRHATRIELLQTLKPSLSEQNERNTLTSEKLK